MKVTESLLWRVRPTYRKEFVSMFMLLSTCAWIEIVQKLKVFEL